MHPYMVSVTAVGTAGTVSTGGGTVAVTWLLVRRVVDCRGSLINPGQGQWASVLFREAWRAVVWEWAEAVSAEVRWEDSTVIPWEVSTVVPWAASMGVAAVAFTEEWAGADANSILG